MDYKALKAELAAGHPVTGVYDKDDAIAADELNAVNRTEPRESVEASELLEAIADADLDGLTEKQERLLYAMLGMGTVNIAGPNTRKLLEKVFASGTSSGASLKALETKSVSRATELKFGTVYEGTVQQARAMKDGS